MRLRRLVFAALSSRRRKAHTLVAVTVAATAAVAAPLVVVTTAAASAEDAAAITPAQVHVDVAAPETVTRGGSNSRAMASPARATTRPSSS